MKTLSTKERLLRLMTIKGIAVAKNPYHDDYEIDVQHDCVLLQFYSLLDAENAEKILMPYFDWFEIHKMTSYKEPRWALYVSLKSFSTHQGILKLH